MIDANEKLGAHEVAAWLRRHPQFLKQFPDLALSLVVPRDEGPAASLASYQLEVLRDKNRELARRLQELFGNAQENERLAVRTHQFTLALMKQGTAADTLRALAATLAEDFNGDLVRVVTFEAVAGLEALGDAWDALKTKAVATTGELINEAAKAVNVWQRMKDDIAKWSAVIEKAGSSGMRSPARAAAARRSPRTMSSSTAAA